MNPPQVYMLARLVATFLPRSKRLLISWLQSPSAVILEPLPSFPAKKNKVCHSINSSIIVLLLCITIFLAAN